MLKFIDIPRILIEDLAQAASKIPAIEKKFSINGRVNGDWPQGPHLWLHGASLGECKMLLNVATFLQEDIPQCPKILITTQKVEVLDYLKKTAPHVSSALAPADTPTALKNFALKVQPVALVLGENELWPGFLSTMKRLSTRPSVAVISGRYHRSFPGTDFSAIGFACMQTNADLSRFIGKAPFALMPKLYIGGDWKLLPWARSQEPVNVPKNPMVDTAFVSMHIGEWASLCPMISSSIKRQEAVVLVPRRLDEVREFKRNLQEQEFIVLNWPNVQKGAVSIVAEFGKTKEVYSQSKTAIVGGSFATGLGVHDCWEPLQMGVATCIGPHTHGQKDTMQTLLQEGVIAQIQSTAEYSKRTIPNINGVQSFLNREREKILESYGHFLNFIKDILKK